eukprot:CAMPEP_0172317580 /NCGR_PEP_ID=MMETSP1058-20130122/32062_1 /TAXON_ID=83371 /ORGANISM="Detonula confervacea, Strain CCMP 353" /LENGTH=617 /DNA_ID=CAMNT_0013032177 /DNA_START=16 /DNA_END=1869 /DNA_ORIENTATION=+
MNTMRVQQQQQQLPPPQLMSLDHSVGNNGGGSTAEAAVNLRQSHLTKFAFLLSSARGEGSDEAVVGMHHDVEMAACFSRRHLCGQQPQQQQGGGMTMHNMMPPPSISSSSLSMQSKHRGQVGSSKNLMLQMVAMNMSTPFYTTPDTVSSTAKTVLKNIVSTMEELMDSRLRSTVSQLMRKSGGIANSQLLSRLLSPSRNPIEVATVITRFVLPDGENCENMGNNNFSSTSHDNMLSIPLHFKAILDVKVFGEVNTVELSAPVTMSGKFDNHDGLLTAVDVSFDCVNLLQTMIGQARPIVKTAVTKAAALSVQIAEWSANKKKKASSCVSGSTNSALVNAAPSTMSLHSLLGSSTSISSLSSLDCGATIGTLFTSFPSLSNANLKKLANKQKSGSSRGLLRNYSRNNNAMAALQNRNKWGNSSSSSTNNANATFDFGNADHSKNANRSELGNRTASTVRFRMPNVASPTCPSSDQKNCSPPSSSASTSASSLSNSQQHQQQAPQGAKMEVPDQQQDKGNIHAGLFSWLQEDSMFLTDEKIQEQNAADAESERKLREAPMPLRFFTAAEDMGGGGCCLEMVSKSIFGGVLEQSNSNNESGFGNQQKKRRLQGDEGHSYR